MGAQSSLKLKRLPCFRISNQNHILQDVVKAVAAAAQNIIKPQPRRGKSSRAKREAMKVTLTFFVNQPTTTVEQQSFSVLLLLLIIVQNLKVRPKSNHF